MVLDSGSAPKRAQTRNDESKNFRRLNQASGATPINPRWRCQCTPLQGSSETMNIRSQTAISALHWGFRVRK
jgi:hypothetical protein